MVTRPEDYYWSSYRGMVGLCDDKALEKDRTLRYFEEKGVLGYREFVEDTGHQYTTEEEEIRASMGEDDLWLP